MVEQYPGLVFVISSVILFTIFLIILKKLAPQLFSNDDHFWN
jgi:hypothetical protein